jgi:hypothetical protein
LLVALWLGYRYILAAVFLMAAVTKLANLNGFKEELLRSEISDNLAFIITAILPWLEMTCGMCLALGFAVREAALLLAVLLAAFLCYSITHLGPKDCGCFLFPVRGPEWIWWPPIRDALLLVCALGACLRVPTRGQDARMA